jgi:hypothetical protein
MANNIWSHLLYFLLQNYRVFVLWLLPALRFELSFLRFFAKIMPVFPTCIAIMSLSSLQSRFFRNPDNSLKRQMKRYAFAFG